MIITGMTFVDLAMVCKGRGRSVEPWYWPKDDKVLLRAHGAKTHSGAGMFSLPPCFGGGVGAAPFSRSEALSSAGFGLVSRAVMLPLRALIYRCDCFRRAVVDVTRRPERESRKDGRQVARCSKSTRWQCCCACACLGRRCQKFSVFWPTRPSVCNARSIIGSIGFLGPDVPLFGSSEHQGVFFNHQGDAA